MNTEEFEQYMNGTLVSDTWDSALIICEVNKKINIYILHIYKYL